MIRPEKWPAESQKWDSYQAFHVGVGRSDLHKRGNYNPSPLVLFDTGELILTKRMPDPDERGNYPVVGVQLTRSDEISGLWTPDGLEVKKAWFKDSGSQWMLIDDQTGRAVRTDVGVVTRDGKIERPNIPVRFQSCAAYIGGPGCHPIGTGVFIVRPVVTVMPQAQQEKIKQLETTFRAHMTLTEHEVTRNDTPANFHRPLPYERALAVSSFDELSNDEYLKLWKAGVDRPKLEFDYLLDRRP